MRDEQVFQRQYYEKTSESYDKMHVQKDEHYFNAILFLEILNKYRNDDLRILDIGAGTGRFQRICLENNQRHDITGIEPVEGLRKIGHQHGVPMEKLIVGDAVNLKYRNDEFNYVVEFGVLHHIREAKRAVEEMCRVAKDGILISDSNNFGQGSRYVRLIKNILRLFRAWWLADYIKTRGKGYSYSEGDGIFYSFSVFDYIDQIEKKFPNIYYLTSEPTRSYNLLFGASHVCVLALREPLY